MPAYAIAASLLLTALSSAQSTKPAAADEFELREWVVFVCDAAESQVNNEQLPSTLPEFVRGKRTAADHKTDPSPVGVIRLFNMPRERVDVLLQLKQGRFLASWPPPESRSDRLLWRNLASVKQPQTVQQLDSGSWFASLQAGESDWLLVRDHVEHFLLYDAAFPFPNPVQISGQHNSYVVRDSLDSPLHDVYLYNSSEGGWRVGHVAVVPSSTRPTARMTADVFEPTTAGSRPSATKPSENSSSGSRITLSTDALSPAEVLAPWKKHLKELGIDESDIALVLRILQKNALDPRWLTAVCRLDESELDRILPLEVVPQPHKRLRVALAIIRNIDPAIESDVDRLIAQLGDADWSKREAASAELLEFGQTARPKLQNALKNPDLEIVYRAERLLARLDKITAAVSAH